MKNGRDVEFDLLCMGRSCIDLYAHGIGVPMRDVKSFDAYVGGCPTNVSVGATRLGLRAALLTALGDDQIGDFVEQFLRNEGVETRFIPRKPGRRTSAVILTIQPPDRFPLTFYRENCADIGLTIEDVDAAPIASSRALFLTGTGLMLDPARTATIHAAERAREAGAQVIVDLDYRPDQWPSRQAYGTNIRALLRYAAIAIGTEEETIAAADSSDVGAAVQRLLATGLAALVVKRGGRGSSVYRGGEAAVDVSPFPVSVLKALGTGDASASGLLYGLHEGWSLDEAARLGNAVGAIVVTRHGCANFMPTFEEVRRFMAERGAPLESVAS